MENDFNVFCVDCSEPLDSREAQRDYEDYYCDSCYNRLTDSQLDGINSELSAIDSIYAGFYGTKEYKNEVKKVLRKRLI